MKDAVSMDVPIKVWPAWPWHKSTSSSSAIAQAWHMVAIAGNLVGYHIHPRPKRPSPTWPAVTSNSGIDKGLYLRAHEGDVPVGHVEMPIQASSLTIWFTLLLQHVIWWLLCGTCFEKNNLRRLRLWLPHLFQQPGPEGVKAEQKLRKFDSQA